MIIKAVDLLVGRNIQIKTMFPISIFFVYKPYTWDSGFSNFNKSLNKAWKYGVVTVNESNLLFKVPVNAFLNRLYVCWLKDEKKKCFCTFGCSTENFHFQFDILHDMFHQIEDKVSFMITQYLNDYEK